MTGDEISHTVYLSGVVWCFHLYWFIKRDGFLLWRLDGRGCSRTQCQRINIEGKLMEEERGGEKEEERGRRDGGGGREEERGRRDGGGGREKERGRRKEERERGRRREGGRERKKGREREEERGETLELRSVHNSNETTLV